MPVPVVGIPEATPFNGTEPVRLIRCPMMPGNGVISFAEMGNGIQPTMAFNPVRLLTGPIDSFRNAEDFLDTNSHGSGSRDDEQRAHDDHGHDNDQGHDGVHDGGHGIGDPLPNC